MPSPVARLLPLSLLGVPQVLGAAAFDPLQYVDQLIGSRNGGNIFPGATLPYGLAKAVADTNSPSNQGGFTLDDYPVSGFSVLHDSGTGGSPSLGNFPLFPYSSCPGDDVNRCDFPKKTRANHGGFDEASVKAHPGYFGITLLSGVEAEMTTTHRAALFQFTFPRTDREGNVSRPLILQDLTDLSDSREDNGTVTVDPLTGRIRGSSRFRASFSRGYYSAYFCTDFSGPDIRDSGIFVNSRASTSVKTLTVSRGINNYPLPGGAFVRFESADTPILARVGISFISSEQACRNAEREIPDYNFSAVEQAAADAWKAKLSPISVSTGGGVDRSLLTNFYSGIYRTMWEVGYEAVLKDAEVEPYDWSSMGRGGLDSWKRLGYIPVQDFDYKGFGTFTRSISRTLEYSYNDFAISQIAKGLNRTSDAEKYINSSGNWRNLFKADQGSAFANGSDTGFVGFFQPRFLNETWDHQDPLWCSAIDRSGVQCSLTVGAKESYESSIWEYSYFVPHNQADLTTLFGGPAEFVRRLDFLHDTNITYIGNEPSFLTVFQYHYAGRPALSALRAHAYIPRYFSPTPGGLPGNDDSGAMGSFVAFAMMGLFPNPGQDVYLITPPFFESVNVTSPATGRTARVRCVDFDPSYKNVYVQSATLDGRPYSKNWLDHGFFTRGGELVLTLGGNESAWGTAIEDLPPSVGEYVGFNETLAGRGSGLRRSCGRPAAAAAATLRYSGRFGLPYNYI
ncbi:hypothetical protein DL764_000932 [Monosporascus ibericus]|uniref:Glycosyl hydrolase family 92 domain-containing protein n=1 Tax=Monosporascus ibericus TaxID=155417 RepID=A0A4Q4TWN8_9PEZI|nr:hypothetical protein DL764_000932 [Monosporascus ibericus]